MGTCRWTYNQAVAYYRNTNDFNAINLTAHYVTKNTRKTLAYPEGKGRPPEWAHDTPASMRGIVMRTLQTNVKSVLSNVKNGKIKTFLKQKGHPTSRSAKVEETPRSNRTGLSLSISKLKNIRVKMDALKEISSEIDILYNNGFWYVAILENAESDPYEYRKSCIALDPGMKAFVTGVGSRRERSTMATFKNQKGKSKRWLYRAYMRAKRTFLSCTAMLKNLVKDLHYKTCAYLIEHYDVILPIFKTKDMVKKSSARTHVLYASILSLNHFKFRQLLQAKCEVRGKSTVVCSEMYTSRTCGL
ncbi:hypothetical protein BBJ28_00021107 [Nothophytophthora sp. Chile5]|nr:hypothetical protein BBJ28_00021107 [Nothophytophthora sp. Chile5]